MRAQIWFSISLLVIGSCGAAEASDNPCNRHPTKRGWHVFADHRDRFCFEYPPQYRSAPPVFAPGVSMGLASRFIGRLTTNPSPDEEASVEDPKAASIDVFAYGIPFRPENLARFAPTGDQENPPQRVHAAHGDFYYYGRGGGGVDYSDDFYFGHRGRTFSIKFVGPFTRSNIPDPETKKLEPEVLATFHSF